MVSARRFRPKARIGAGWLAAALAFSLAGMLLIYATRAAAPNRYRDLQLKASARMAEAERQLLEALVARGIPVEKDVDLNGTGLIGPEWTPLTTTLGILEAKRTTLDPNFAALLVRYFAEAGLKSGDVVAVGASGSFPGLALATLCAAREMGLRPIVIASFGASMYGATRPEFTIPDMMRVLVDASLIPDSLAAVSPGSDGDFGANPLFDGSRDIIRGLAEKTGVEFIDFGKPDLEASIRSRLEIYERESGGFPIRCFVNIGGASPNSGESSYTLDFPQGLVTDPPRIPGDKNRGLIYEFAARGVPVINLLNIKRLASENGLPYDPYPLPQPGQGGVYDSIKYSKPLIAATLIIVIATLVLGALRSRRRARCTAPMPEQRRKN